MRQILAIFAIVVLSGALLAQDQAPEAKALYSEAVKAFNAGRMLEAKTTVAKLIEKYPRDYFLANSFFWDLVSRTEDTQSMKIAVRRSLDFLETVSEDSRTEEYYQAFIDGLERLGQKAQVEELKKHAILKFPRGTLAQSAQLEFARQENDPIKAAAAYQNYINDFHENVSWTEVAARSKFGVIAGHLKLFEQAEVLKTAEQYDGLTIRFVEKFGNPARRVVALARIAEALAEYSPETSLEYARKGLAFIQEFWPRTDEFTDESRYQFWPAMLRAYSTLGKWAEAARIGNTFTSAVDRGLVPLSVTEINEAEVRKTYAVALETLNRIEEARVQLGWAASLNNKFALEFADFIERYPTDRELFEKHLSARREKVERLREELVKSELLAQETRRAATDFSLKGLAGEVVSLSNFKGKVVVLDFWATWCGPCIAELEELKRAFEKYQDNSKVTFLTVSIDKDKSLVAPFAEQRGYRFPVLLTDGTIEEPYKTQTIPRLYIIDPEGNIRFEVTGYLKDGYYLRKLDWMIEVASKPHPVQ